MNSSALYSNWTQISNSAKSLNTYKYVFIAMTIIFFSLFFCFVLPIFHVFFTTPHVRETSRYILFAHMLINDTVYLVIGFVLLLTTITASYIPVTGCYAIVTLASVTFRITPYNLAVMAIECYAAICFPLKHAIVCTPQRSNYAIVIMWVVSLVPNCVDFIILITLVEKTFFSLKVICTRENLTVEPLQATVRSIALIANLSLSGLIIIFSYIGVMLVAKRANSGSSSASKAGGTVMIHAFQFLLCLLSLAYPFLEVVFARYLSFLPFANFMILSCLPRCLSPLIYGIRDSVFSKRMRLLYKISITTLYSGQKESRKPSWVRRTLMA